MAAKYKAAASNVGWRYESMREDEREPGEHSFVRGSLIGLGRPRASSNFLYILGEAAWRRVERLRHA